MLLTPRNAMRIADWPFAAGLREGAYELSSGQRLSSGKYTKSAWAYAAMQIRASELARLSWRIVRNDEVVKNHPLYEMLTNFGRESNWAEVMGASEIDMLMTGAGYWLIDGTELRRLSSPTMSVKADRTGIQEFVQTIQGTIVNRFKRDEVVYFREHDPDNDLLPGVPVIDVIKSAIAQEYEASKYVEAFFKNDAVPGLLLSTEQSVPELEMNKIIGWWNKKFKGARNAHKVAFADKGMKAQLLSGDLGKQALVEIREQARNDICVGMRVPKVLLDIQGATFANAAEGRKFLLEDTVIPRADYYADVINEDLVDQVDPSVTFEFATDELEILQEDATAKWARLASAINAGAITPEFARQEMGWPETAAPEVQEQPLTPEQIDLRAWRRKSLKALRSAGSAAVEFESRVIRSTVRAALSAQLAGAKTSTDVLGVFDGMR